MAGESWAGHAVQHLILSPRMVWYRLIFRTRITYQVAGQSSSTMEPLNRRILAVPSAVIAVWQLSGCATNPVIGNLEFVLMSEKKVVLGDRAHWVVLKRNDVYGNPETGRSVRWLVPGERAIADGHQIRLVRTRHGDTFARLTWPAGSLCRGATPTAGRPVPERRTVVMEVAEGRKIVAGTHH